MTESELENTLDLLYKNDRYLYDCLCFHLVTLDKKIERYERALNFYADTENYELSPEAKKVDLVEFINNLDLDNGEIARNALEGK